MRLRENNLVWLTFGTGMIIIGLMCSTPLSHEEQTKLNQEQFDRIRDSVTALENDSNNGQDSTKQEVSDLQKL